jgi:hypothetical protein
MKMLPLIAIVAVLMVPAHAGLITFGTRAAFNAAAGALPMETFESGTSAPNTFVPCPSPESSTSNNGCFGLGALLPGIQYQTNGSDLPPGQEFALGDGTATLHGTRLLFTNNPTGSFDIFLTASNAIGLDVLLFSGGSIDVNVFDPSNALIQTFTLATTNAGVFFGVISDSGLIGHINLATSVTPNSNYEGVDNVAFGLTAASVPEPSTLGMLGLGAAALALARRRVLSR